MKIVLGAKGSQVNVIYACYIIISVPSIVLRKWLFLRF